MPRCKQVADEGQQQAVTEGRGRVTCGPETQKLRGTFVRVRANPQPSTSLEDLSEGAFGLFGCSLFPTQSPAVCAARSGLAGGLRLLCAGSAAMGSELGKVSDVHFAKHGSTGEGVRLRLCSECMRLDGKRRALLIRVVSSRCELLRVCCCFVSGGKSAQLISF